jgi:hypothetical protein
MRFALQNRKTFDLNGLRHFIWATLRVAILQRLAKIDDLCKMLRKLFHPKVFCEGKAQTIGHFTGH